MKKILLISTLIVLVSCTCRGGDGFSARDDLHRISEDSGTTTILILANDRFSVDSPYTVILGAALNGLASLSDSNTVTYKPNLNFNCIEVITYSLLQGNKKASANIIVTVDPVNDVPVSSITNFSVYENEASICRVSFIYYILSVFRAK